MTTEKARIDIYIDEDMDVKKRASLVTKLEYERGIISAWFEDGNQHCVTIEYEPDHFSHTTLLDALKEHGYHGKVITA